MEAALGVLSAPSRKRCKRQAILSGCHDPNSKATLQVTAMRPKHVLFVSRSWLWLGAAALLILTGCCGSGNSSGSSGSLADALIPGRKEAEFRDRVQHDSFPTATEAMRSPAQSDDK